MPFQFTCETCAVVFSRPARRFRHFCSNACRAESLRRHVPDEDVYWPQVDTSGGPDACWPWLGKTLGGYGYMVFQGETRKTHRIAYYLEHGTWPTPCALHTCDFPPCCNPAHLFEGDQADNNADRDAKGRGHFPGKPRKLTNDQVQEIRQRYAAGGIFQRDLAVEFGVSRRTINLITLGRVRLKA